MSERRKPVPVPKKGSIKAMTKVREDSNKDKCSLKENYSAYLVPYDRHSAITSQMTQKAMHLLLPRVLAKHAMSEGTKAFTK